MDTEKPFEFIEHTGDLKLKVFGRDFLELFQNAALGLMNYLFGSLPADLKQEIQEHLTVQARDRETLLADWLSELLFLSETNKMCYFKFRFGTLTETELRAEVSGVPQPAKEAIKAVTYHGLKISRTSSGYEAVILFDI